MKMIHSCTKVVFLTVLLAASSLHASVVYYALPSALQNPSGLAEGPDGSIYGAAVNGGDFNKGAIFKMTPAGQFTIVHSFNWTDGAYPSGGLTLVNGNFYGSAALGGDNGVGTVFKLTPAGGLTGLYSFVSGSDLGCNPGCPLLAGIDGNLYGATMVNTPAFSGPQYGSIFKTALDGTTTEITSPGNVQGMVQYPNGDIYGVKYSGDIFRLLSDGTLTVIAHIAANPSGGNGLLIGQDGNMYGCSMGGGVNGTGCVYRLTTAGDVTVLGSFDGFEDSTSGEPPSNTTGFEPRALIQGADGNFYGTTTYGAQYGWGGVFQMTPAGVINPVISFVTTNGVSPLLQATDGNIYGASSDTLPAPSIATRVVARRSGYIFSVHTHGFPTGKYNGLFAETNNAGDTVVNVASAGMIKNMNVNPLGVFSGKLLLAGAVYQLGGSLETAGNATVTVPVAGGSVVVTMSLDSATGTITGSVAESTGKWTAALRANRGLTKASSGRFTVLIPSADTTGVASPPGAGHEVINDVNGVVNFSGALADGTAAASSVPIAANGDVPLYVRLYHGQGLLYGWINLSGTPTGSVTWISPAATGSPLYPTGFTNRNISIVSSQWTKPTAGSQLIAVNNGTLTISGAGLGTPLTYTVTGTATKGDCLQVVASNNSNPLQAIIDPANGALTLKVKRVAGRTITATGVLLQNTTTAGGACVFLHQAGAFTLTQ